MTRIVLIVSILLALYSDANAQDNRPEQSNNITSQRPVRDAPNIDIHISPDIADIIRRGEIVVAIYRLDTFPFYYDKNGSLTGIDVKLVQSLANDLGVAVRFDRSSTTFDEIVDRVALGQADLGIGKLARTLKRSQKVIFSDTYLKIDHALLINRLRLAQIAGNRSVTEVIRSFDGRIGVIERSAWVEFGKRNFPKASIITYSSWAATVEAVKRGDIDAAYRDEHEIKSILQSDSGLSLTLRTVSFSDMQSHLSIAIGAQNTVLRGYVNEFISQQTERPTIDDVLKAVRQ